MFRLVELPCPYTFFFVAGLMMTGDEAKFAAILWKQGHFCSKFNCGV
jgi:hypothetical protein